MASICRLCATLKKIETFVNIHEVSLNLCMKLEKCCQVIVPKTNDVLPQNVCSECVENLNSSWKFFQKVHESQESLSEIFYIPSNQNIIHQNKKLDISSVSCSGFQSENNISSSSDNVTYMQNSEVERLLQNITIIGRNDRFSNGILRTNPECDSDKSLNIELAEQITFEGLEDSDFAIATGTLVAVDSNQNHRINSDCIDSDTLQLNNFKESIYVNSEVNESENKFNDQTIDQIKNELEDQEGHNDEINNRDNIDQENSTSTTVLSTSLSKSMLMESLNEEDLEMLGSWNDYIWKCIYCSEYIAENAHNLRDHIISEHQDKTVKYICTDCLKTFDRYYTFINHVKSRHRVQLQLCCDLCSQFCDSADILAQHRNTAHIDDFPVELNRFGKPKPNENDLSYCDICAKAFKNKAALLVHSKGHQPSDEKNKFPCEFCDKTFSSKANWKAHHKIHVGLKDFVCALCGKGFVQKANLDEHMLTHTENTPYECEECNRRFKTSERLAKHISVHSDIRPHKCTICGSSFREKDTLRVHSRIHTGEMPYSCDFCGKRFRFRSVLKTHRHQHTGERPYSCLNCNHHFTNWPNYNKHMKRRHGINTRNGQPNTNVNMKIENDLTASVTTSSSSTSHLSLITTLPEQGKPLIPVKLQNNKNVSKKKTLSTPSSSSSSSSLSLLQATTSLLSSRTRRLNQISEPMVITQISDLSSI